jgi:septal ring factor EnvC (AmiA/AmiB activator)
MKKLAPKKANAAPKQKQHQPSTGSTDELETKIGTLEAQEQVLRTKMQRISKQAATLQRKRDALKIRAYDALKRPNGKQGASSASAGSSIRSPADARRVRSFFPLISSDLNSF